MASLATLTRKRSEYRRLAGEHLHHGRAQLVTGEWEAAAHNLSEAAAYARHAGEIQDAIDKNQYMQEARRG